MKFYFQMLRRAVILGAILKEQNKTMWETPYISSRNLYLK
jgi:hypothetical protein